MQSQEGHCSSKYYENKDALYMLLVSFWTEEFYETENRIEKNCKRAIFYYDITIGNRSNHKQDQSALSISSVCLIWILQ